MVLAAYNLDTELWPMQCGTCGVWHAIPATMHENCKAEGGFWFCPNGHQRGYSEGSLRAQLEREKKRRQWAEENARRAREREDEAERRRAAQKAATTRLRNRAKAGLCPCCNRHFKQLAAHMANKHPNFEAEQDDS